MHNLAGWAQLPAPQQEKYIDIDPKGWNRESNFKN